MTIFVISVELISECVDGNIRNPALPVMPRHYQQKDEISFIKELVG